MYETIKTEKRKHRMDTFGEHMIAKAFVINEVDMFIAKLDSDNLWWIIPKFYEDEETVHDFGPFNDVASAIVYAKLIQY